MSAISVAVHTPDPITELGLVGHIRLEPQLTWIAPNEASKADVVVLAVENADASALEAMRLLSSSDPRFVVIVDKCWSADLREAVECGVRAVLWRAEFTPERFTRSVVSVAAGRGDFPPSLQGRLMDQVEQTYRNVLVPRGLTSSGLSQREIDVLRLVAEGSTVEEIAAKLSYSERTVKNVLHGLMKRLNLRNRAHAVTYALRCGLI